MLWRSSSIQVATFLFADFKILKQSFAVKVNDFGPSWRDGNAFVAVVNSIRPGNNLQVVYIMYILYICGHWLTLLIVQFVLTRSFLGNSLALLNDPSAYPFKKVQKMKRNLKVAREWAWQGTTYLTVTVYEYLFTSFLNRF